MPSFTASQQKSFGGSLGLIHTQADAACALYPG